MTNRVKVGIVGAGGISYTYLKNLTETFHITEVVGIADIGIRNIFDVFIIN